MSTTYSDIRGGRLRFQGPRKYANLIDRPRSHHHTAHPLEPGFGMMSYAESYLMVGRIDSTDSCGGHERGDRTARSLFKMPRKITNFSKNYFVSLTQRCK
jgi:hypothetical protein